MLKITVKRKRKETTKELFATTYFTTRIPLQKAQRSVGTFSRILDSPWSAPTCLSLFARQSMAGLFPIGFSRYGGSFKREQSKFQGKDLEIYFPPSAFGRQMPPFRNRVPRFDLWRRKGLPDQATVWNHYRWNFVFINFALLDTVDTRTV